MAIVSISIATERSSCLSSGFCLSVYNQSGISGIISGK